MRFITMMGTAALTMTATTFGAITISEIRTGSGNAEYVELQGNPGESLAGLTLLIVGDGTSTGATPTKTGVIEWIWKFGATDVIGANGYLVLHNPGQNPANTADTSGAFPFTVDPNCTNIPWTYQADGLAASTQIEGADNQTYMLVSGFSGTDTYITRAPNAGAGGQDLDENDDGVLDVTPWTAIVDQVSLKETNGSTPLAGQDWWYAPVACGPYITRTVVTATSGTTIAGWDFQTTTNTNTGTAAAAKPNTPKLYNSNAGVGTMYLDGTNGASDWSQTTELDAFTGTSLNATGTAAGGNGLDPATSTTSSLALVAGTANTANGKSVVFKFSMTGFSGLNVSYACRQSSSTLSFTTHTWQYSTNGTDWTDVPSGVITGLTTSFKVFTIPAFTALDGQATAYLKCTVSGASGSGGSNNRLDNVLFFSNPVTTPTIVTSYGAPVHAFKQPSGAWAIGNSAITAPVDDTVGAANAQLPTYSCGDPNAGDAATAHNNPFCSDACCCTYVGGLDAFCNTVRWDSICVGLAANCAANCSAPPCPADLNHDHVVNGADLGTLLGAWGGPDADLNGDGVTNGADLGSMLGAWGACP